MFSKYLKDGCIADGWVDSWMGGWADGWIWSELISVAVDITDVLYLVYWTPFPPVSAKEI